MLCCFMLSGCALFSNNTAELLKPPALAGENSKIANAIAQSAGDDYTLTYPARGQYRSAVVQNDIDGDGIEEALALYAKTEEEEMVMYADLFFVSEGKWKSVAKRGIVAGGVDRVEFSDLDGDGKKEIIIGWEIYGTSEMQLGIYSFRKNELVERMLEQYTSFACCDLNEDKKDDILLVYLNTAEQTNTAFLYGWDGMEAQAKMLCSCPLDSSVKTVNEPIVATLSSGKPAVYLDEIKGAGAVTEVLLTRGESLVNPLFNPESGETAATLRSAALNVKDINDDGVVEIPVQRSVPSVLESETNEKLYLTDWCSFDGETLTTQMTAMMNMADGYYYVLPEGMTDQIAILKDTEEHIREIYRYRPETGEATELLVSFVAVPTGSDGATYQNEGYHEILSDRVLKYLCKTGSAKIDGFSLKEIKASFRIIE